MRSGPNDVRGPCSQDLKRLRPHRAADMQIGRAVSASVRAGGGAPAPVQKRWRLGRVGRHYAVDIRMKYIWIIPLLPGIGALINGLVGIRFFSRRLAGLLACATMTAALGLALVAFFELLGQPAEARAHDVVVAQWIPRIPLA